MTNKLINEESLEKKLWKAADKLRKNMDAAEYKHVGLCQQKGKLHARYKQGA